jgi:hypothetical protein
MSTTDATARPRARKLLTARQLSRLLYGQRPVKHAWHERHELLWDELAAGFDPGDHERLAKLKMDISDGEGEYWYMELERLLLAVGTICLANERPDIWRQISDVWNSDLPPETGGEMELLDQLADKARRGEI